jgi:hypothetical protein
LTPGLPQCQKKRNVAQPTEELEPKSKVLVTSLGLLLKDEDRIRLAPSTSAHVRSVDRAPDGRRTCVEVAAQTSPKRGGWS